MARWVSDKTLDAAMRAIKRAPGISRDDVATAIGLSPGSICHVVGMLRENCRVAPWDVYQAIPERVIMAVELDQRILRRARKGLISLKSLVAELAGEGPLADDPPDTHEPAITPGDIRAALLRLRYHKALVRPPGLYPMEAMHDRGLALKRRRIS